MIKLSTKRNPLGLAIGDRVKATRSVTIEYDGRGNKIVMTEVDGGISGQVIGVGRKALGKYVKNPNGDFYAPRYTGQLKVDKYIIVYECKTCIEGPSFFVLPEEIY